MQDLWYQGDLLLELLPFYWISQLGSRAALCGHARSLLGQLLLSLSLEHLHTEEGSPAPLGVDIRLGSSRFLSQVGEKNNIWAWFWDCTAWTCRGGFS